MTILTQSGLGSHLIEGHTEEQHEVMIPFDTTYLSLAHSPMHLTCETPLDFLVEEEVR